MDRCGSCVLSSQVKAEVEVIGEIQIKTGANVYLWEIRLHLHPNEPWDLTLNLHRQCSMRSSSSRATLAASVLHVNSYINHKRPHSKRNKGLQRWIVTQSHQVKCHYKNKTHNYFKQWWWWCCLCYDPVLLGIWTYWPFWENVFCHVVDLRKNSHCMTLKRVYIMEKDFLLKAMKKALHIWTWRTVTMKTTNNSATPCDWYWQFIIKFTGLLVLIFYKVWS